MASQSVKTQERFAQYAFLALTESAANTLTSLKLETGLTVADKRAWLISRIEYTLPLGLLVGSADGIEFGIAAVQASVMDLPLSTDQGVLDYNNVGVGVWGAAANAQVYDTRHIRDWSQLPGGGLLTSGHSIYAWVKGTSLASACSVYVKIWYQTLELANDEFWDLVQLHQPLRA